MASLNQLSSQVATNIGRPFDVPLKKRIADLFKNVRAKYLRQSIQKYGVDEVYIQKYVVPTTTVDIADSCAVSIGCDVRRTTNKIANPIRYTNDAPFLLVASPSGKLIITFSQLFEVQLGEDDPYFGVIPRYSYVNNYIYLYNTNISNILVQAAYESPELIIPSATGDTCTLTATGICYTDDMEFPIPMDLIHDIKLEVYRELGFNKIPAETIIKMDSSEE